MEGELSLDEWIKVLENITRFKVDVITFGGGEPFVRKDDLVKLVKFVVSRGITVNIVTNGTLVSGEALEEIAEFKDRVTFLVSCDGLEEENDRIRGAGTFKKVIKAVNLIRDRGFTLYITSVIMPENFANFTGFLKYMHSNYPEVSIDIQPVIPHNEIYYRRRKFDLDDNKMDQLREVIEFLRDNEDIKLCRPLRLIDKYPDYFKGTLVTQNQCKMGTASFNINLRGNIWICGKELEFPLHKYKLEEVLSSREYLQEMERVKNCKSPCLAGLVI
jgi:MoaA/NifB/PqqE/SkfB family radical SAM enzyme